MSRHRLHRRPGHRGTEARGGDLHRGQTPEDPRNRRSDEETDRRQVDLLVNALDTGGDTLLTARQGRHIVATVAAASNPPAPATPAR